MINPTIVFCFWTAKSRPYTLFFQSFPFVGATFSGLFAKSYPYVNVNMPRFYLTLLAGFESY